MRRRKPQLVRHFQVQNRESNSYSRKTSLQVRLVLAALVSFLFCVRREATTENTCAHVGHRNRTYNSKGPGKGMLRANALI